MKEKIRDYFKIIALLFLCFSSFILIMSFSLIRSASSSSYQDPNLRIKTSSNHLVNASANSSTISYAGLNSYGDIRNFYYAEGGLSAYVDFISNVGSVFEGYLVYEFPDTYYDIENFTIWIKERRVLGSGSLEVFVLNASSGNFVNISFNLGSEVSYINHSFTIENGTYPDIDDFFNTNQNQIMLKIKSNKTQSAKWMVDWTDIALFGTIDSIPPTILYFTRNETNPYDNQTILFNVTAIDDLSGIANVSLRYFSSALYPNITFYRDVTVTKVNDSYVDYQQIFNGTWNVTAFVTDNEGNVANQSMSFSVIGTGIGHVFLFPNSTEVQRTESVLFDVYIIAGIRRHKDLWIYDAFLNSNITLGSGINNFSSLHYQYVAIPTFFGEFKFIAYLNDQIGSLFSSMPQNISVIQDTTRPNIFFTNISDLRVGIEDPIEIAFTINTTNHDFNISDIIIEDVFLSSIIYLQKDLNTTEFSDTLTITNFNVGDHPLRFFANDSYGNSQTLVLELHWEVLPISPQINVYANRISQFSFQPITLFITVIKTEYNLSHISYFDPFLSTIITIASGLGDLDQTSVEHVIIGTLQGIFILTIMVEDIFGNLESVEIPLTFYIVDPRFPEITTTQGVLLLFAIVLIISLSVYATSKFVGGKAYNKRLGVKESKFLIKDKKRGRNL